MKSKTILTTLALHTAALFFCAHGQDPGLPMPAIFDETIALVRKGEKIPKETLEQCEKAYKQYVADLHVENDVAQDVADDFAANGHWRWRNFLEADRMNYFMAYVKMSIIQPEKYLNMFQEWGMLTTCHEGFKRLRLTDDSALVLLCSICAAVKKGDEEYMVSAYKELLEKDPFLARHLLKFYTDPNTRFLQLIKDLPKPDLEKKGK